MSEETTSIETTTPDAGGEPAAADVNLETQAGESSSPESGREPESTAPIEGEDKPEGEKPEGDGQDKKPAPDGLRKRFAELTGKVRMAEGEKADLAAKVEALEAKLASKDQPPAQPQGQDEPQPPKWDDFQDDAAFREAERKYLREVALRDIDREMDSRERQREQQRQAQAQAEKDEAWRYDVFEKGSAKYGQEFEKAFLPPDKGGIAFTLPMVDAIRDEAAAPDVIAYLVKKPDEAARIAGLHPIQQIKAMARLQGMIEQQAKTHKPTKAPPPVNPVQGRSGTSKDPAKMSDSEWYAEQQRARTGAAKR